METNAKKRLGAGAALLFLSPALLLTLSGCRNSQNCDDDRSTPTTSDDCGTRRSRVGTGGGFINRGGSFGAGRSTARSGGFGGFGRVFSGGS